MLYRKTVDPGVCQPEATSFGPGSLWPMPVSALKNITVAKINATERIISHRVHCRKRHRSFLDRLIGYHIDLGTERLFIDAGVLLTRCDPIFASDEVVTRWGRAVSVTKCPGASLLAVKTGAP